jgi:CubicO group peptidase (beta-lactamase class C family)
MTEKLQANLAKQIDNKLIFGASLQVNHGTDVLFAGSAGNLAADSRYFIASTTKLYTTAVIMQLVDAGKVNLSDKVTDYFAPGLLSGICQFHGVDYSAEITIKHLLAHTSGLADYFQDRDASGSSLELRLVSGADEAWDLTKVIEIAKRQPAKFAPGTPGKAHYSDTNFQLLGGIIKAVTQQSIGAVFTSNIFEPLQLSRTYLFDQQTTDLPIDLNYKSAPLRIPQAMSSFQADGGIVSTTAETMKFVQAFFGGKLFDPKHIATMTSEYNRIFFPLQYGVGIMKVELPRIMTLWRKFPILLGHSGLSGAFAYYAPELDVYFSGTLNQVSNPGKSYRFLIQTLQAVQQQLHKGQ